MPKLNQGPVRVDTSSSLPFSDIAAAVAAARAKGTLGHQCSHVTFGRCAVCADPMKPRNIQWPNKVRPDHPLAALEMLIVRRKDQESVVRYTPMHVHGAR